MATVITRITNWWLEQLDQYDRYLLAKQRFPAHQLAMKEGRNSPYTHPEQYEFE